MHSGRSLSLVIAWVFLFTTASLMSSTTLFANAGVVAGVVLVATVVCALVAWAVVCRGARDGSRGSGDGALDKFGARGGSRDGARHAIEEAPARGVLSAAIACFVLGTLSLVGALIQMGVVRCWCIVGGFVLALVLTVWLYPARRLGNSREVLAMIAGPSGFILVPILLASGVSLNSSGDYWCTMLLAFSSLLPFAAGVCLLIGVASAKQAAASSYWGERARHQRGAGNDAERGEEKGAGRVAASGAKRCATKGAAVPNDTSRGPFLVLALAILAVVSFLSGFMLSPFNVDNVGLLCCLFAAGVVSGVPLFLLAREGLYSARLVRLVPMVFSALAILVSIVGLVVYLAGFSGRFVPLSLVFVATAFALSGGCAHVLALGGERTCRPGLVVCVGMYVFALFAGVGFRQLVGVDEANIMFLIIGSLAVLLIAVSFGAIMVARSSRRELTEALSELSSSQEIADMEASRRIEAETLASEEASRREQAEAMAQEAMRRRAEAESMAFEANAAANEAKRAALSAHEQTAEAEFALEQANEKMREADAVLNDVRRRLREADTARKAAERMASEVLEESPEVAKARVAQARSEELARFGLTKRENEIALVLLGGLTAEGISERLGISVNTVRFHCKNIYRKCGVNNRAAFVRLIEKAPGSNSEM